MQDALIEEYARVYRNILKNTTKLINDPDLALQAADIEKVLIDSGYYQAGQRVLTEGQQAAMDASIDFYRQAMQEDLQYQPAALQTLESMRAMNAGTITQQGMKLSNELLRPVTELALGLSNKDAALDAIAKALDISSAQATSWARTALQEVHRTSTVLLGEQAGLEMYKYMGPMDMLTRPFCEQHVGEVRPLSEWKAMSNGQIGTAATNGGGYNCRHRLIPVVKEV